MYKMQIRSLMKRIPRNFSNIVKAYNRMDPNKKIIIDTDPGIDDAQAIMMALGKDSSVDVVAITTVQGNVSVLKTTRNTLRLLKVANRQDIPVFKGCELPLLESPQCATFFHGEDGFGDSPDSKPPGLEHLQKEHAVNTLINLVNQSPGELNLVAIGPLTNIATALSLDSKFGSKLKSCYIMGGNYRGMGNVTRSSEFNFYNDPESAHIVLKRLSCPITIVTWEMCEDFKQPASFLENLRSLPGKKAAFLRDIFRNTTKRSEERNRYIMCDELAMAAVMNEQCILDSKELYAEVELNGTITRGQMVPDWRNVTGKPNNVRIITKMDLKLVEELLLNICDF